MHCGISRILYLAWELLKVEVFLKIAQTHQWVIVLKSSRKNRTRSNEVLCLLLNHIAANGLQKHLDAIPRSPSRFPHARASGHRGLPGGAAASDRRAAAGGGPGEQPLPAAHGRADPGELAVGEAALAAFDPGGLEVLEADLAAEPGKPSERASPHGAGV
jgi:hypothetical protein